MEQNELKPQDNQSEFQTTTPLTPEIQPPLSEQKRFPKLAIIIPAVLVIALLTGGLVFNQSESIKSAQSKNSSDLADVKKLSSPQPKAVEQVITDPASGVKTNIKQAEHYTVKVGETEYYGLVTKINKDFIRMSPTAYKNKNALTFTGGELHAPESSTYFKVSKVTSFSELTDPAIIAALKSKEGEITDKTLNKDIDTYIKSSQMQAYFFADGTSLFSKTTSLDGTFLSGVNKVYYLQTSNTGTTNTTVSLVAAKPEQYNKLTADSLMYWQNMKPDGQVSKAARTFEQQNPTTTQR